MACNFKSQPQTIAVNLAAQHVNGTRLKTLIASPGTHDPASTGAIQLPPFGVYVGEIE